MPNTSAHAAAIPNPALKPYEVLIGEWTTVGTHFLMPGVTLHGRTSFQWIEGGAFLMMRSEIDEPKIPSASAVIGTDDAAGGCFMLYFDERGVSRKQEVSLEGDVLKWWRNAPGFSQRFAGTITDGGRTIVGKGELCEDGSTWHKDLDLTYTRVG